MSRPLICDICGTTISEHPTQFTQYAEVKRRGVTELNKDIKYDLCVECLKRIFEKGSDPDENEEDCDAGLSELVKKLFPISKEADEGSDPDENE